MMSATSNVSLNLPCDCSNVCLQAGRLHVARYLHSANKKKKNTCDPVTKSLVNQDYGVFTRCMHKESGLWCSLVSCETSSRWVLKLWFRACVCVCVCILASGTAICVRQAEPEVVNVRLSWSRRVVLLRRGRRKATSSGVAQRHSPDTTKEPLEMTLRPWNFPNWSMCF